MDSQIFSLLLTFVFLLLIIWFLMTPQARVQTSKPIKLLSLKLPPGPWKLPFIGNIHQLFGSLAHHKLFELSKEYGPLMHIKLGEVSNVIVSSPEMAKEVLKTHDMDFAQRSAFLAPMIISYGCTNIVFSPYGGYWRQLRKICMMELLSEKRVQSFRRIRHEEVSNFIKTISSNGRSPINLSRMIFSLTYGVTSRAAFGKKHDDQGAFISAIHKVVELAAGFSVVDMYPSIKVLQLLSGMRSKLVRLHKETDRILESIINEHRNRKTEKSSYEEDLVDVLLRLQKEGGLDFPLSDDNIKSVILDMFSAGSDTSSTVVEWVMSELLKTPSTMRKAQEEIRQLFKGRGHADDSEIRELKFLKSVVLETMRLHPPLPLVPRECRSSCEIAGYHIPVKTKVLINTWAIGRDPKYWTEPEKFYPERFLHSSTDLKGNDFEFIPFGAGRRVCPGITFALANIELPLAHLLYHFDWELPNQMKHEDLDMTEAYGLVVRRKEDLFLVPVPYNPTGENTFLRMDNW
ncbi:hypothetical protein K2173_015421 [Erythroxylum novogranatense]|uniref:Cytochrome P450 n=1 Tax=Erythroxylum novogranatense TaxID=1862640 RepID=A0AAV8SSC4_9ROSI|nr:hypothetical protein K2173_015421 [Erythroxylum novogranatense]